MREVKWKSEREGLPLNDDVRFLWNLTPLVHNANALATGGCWWLDDPLHLMAAVIVPRFFQQLRVHRETEGLRKKVVLLLPDQLLHMVQILPKAIFAAELEGAGIMIVLKRHHNVYNGVKLTQDQV